jgi:hypothetical protein
MRWYFVWRIASLHGLGGRRGRRAFIRIMAIIVLRSGIRSMGYSLSKLGTAMNDEMRYADMLYEKLKLSDSERSKLL